MRSCRVLVVDQLSALFLQKAEVYKLSDMAGAGLCFFLGFLTVVIGLLLGRSFSESCEYFFAICRCARSLHDLAFLRCLLPMMLAAAPRVSGCFPNRIGPSADPLEPFIRHLFLLRECSEQLRRAMVPPGEQ
ncbi:hypothetical protein GGD54_002680 [Rhizobium tropici]|nr:hypothetical protein [Rhizobium tropici]